MPPMKYWEIIADKLSAGGWSWVIAEPLSDMAGAGALTPHREGRRLHCPFRAGGDVVQRTGAIPLDKWSQICQTLRLKQNLNRARAVPPGNSPISFQSCDQILATGKRKMLPCLSES
jgi:hypothetical protein